MRLREIIEQPQQQLDDPVLATDEGLQQSWDQMQVIIDSSSGRRQGSPNDQTLTREYLEETVGSDGINGAAVTPASRQETFRGSSSTEIAGRSNKDKIHSLGGMASQRFNELELQGQSEQEQLLMNELNLVQSENKDLSRRIGEMEAKFAIFEQCMSMRSMQQYPPTGTMFYSPPAAQMPYSPSAAQMSYPLRGEQSSLRHHSSSHQPSDNTWEKS